MNKQHTILVVEDEKDLQEAIRIKLEDGGFKVICANNVPEAKEVLESRAKEISLAWIDHYLPGETGLDLVGIIKANPDWTHIPIFVVSNSDNSERYFTYINLTTVKYYTKAVTPLQDIIDDIIGVFKAKED